MASIPSVELFLTALATAQEIPTTGTASLLDQVLAGLQNQNVLLVLDHGERLFDAIPVVRQILAAAPGVKIVLASRAPLRLRDEYEFPVPPLTAPNGDALSQILSRLSLWSA